MSAFEGDFTRWCIDELVTPEMVKAEDLLQRYCDLHILKVFRDLKLHDLLAEPKTANELAAALQFDETADLTLDFLLRRLSMRLDDFIEVDENCPSRFRATKVPSDPSCELARLRQEMTQLGCGYAAALDFLDFGAQNFVRSLREDPEFMDRVLSGRELSAAELWHRATNTDPLQDVHGKMGARAVRALFEGGTILEIGGGTGNGTLNLFRAMEEAGDLDRIQGYIFTDVSIPFVLATRRLVKELFPKVRCDWRLLDINQSLVGQSVEPESVDLIYGVNAAHVASNIVEFLKQCCTVLRPGGKVVFAERVRLAPREMAPREFTLNLSRYHRGGAQRNPEYRPMPCYLYPPHWLRVLELAGFSRPTILPDLDAIAQLFPNWYAAIVTATKADGR